MIEKIEWLPTTQKPEEFVPILVYLPNEEPYPTVREAYYLTIDGVGEWNVVHPMYGGFIPEKEIDSWAYMPKGIPSK